MKALFKNANEYANGEFKKQTMLLDGASLSIFMGCVLSDYVPNSTSVNR